MVQLGLQICCYHNDKKGIDMKDFYEKFSIGGKIFDAFSEPYCVAEVGINHNGNLDTALKMIEVAKESHADAVKFQTFKADEFCGDPNQEFSYHSEGKKITEKMVSMFKRYELSEESWKIIKKRCDDVGITFFSSPQNKSDLDFLLKIGVSVIKVGSDDFTNIPLLKSYVETKLPIILSCGMSDLSEVYQALEAVGWFLGYPVGLLLCTSEYPTPPNDININKLLTLKNAFPGLLLGFSDHSQGHLAATLAVGMGAKIFEKHFTLSNDLKGPDHWFSENPEGLKDWVSAIKTSYKMLGSPHVKPTQNELVNKKEFQRVIVASKQIFKDEKFSKENLCMRRVAGGDGFSPAIYESLIGKKAWKNFSKFEPIKFS